MRLYICLLTCLVCFGLVVCGSSDAATGYDETVAWWRGVVSQTSQYQQILQDHYAQVESQIGQDKSRLNAEFSKSIARKYPGSAFHGSFGTLAINNYTTISFDSRWNINVLRQRFGSLNKTYDFRDQSLEIVNGPNRVKAKYDLNRPDRSRFTIAEVPAVTATAQRIWIIKGTNPRIPQPLKEILNDTYFARLANEGIRMDQLAEQIVEDQATRRSVLNIAEELYSRPATDLKVLPSKTQSQSSRSFNLIDWLPWYFWPVVIGIGVFNALGSTKRRRSRKQRTLAYSGQRDFSMGRPSRGFGIKLGKRPTLIMPKDEQIFPTDIPDACNHKPQEWSLDILASLEWKRFETVCAEYLRLIGFNPKETRIGADGGVDIWVYKEGIEKPVGIVQCKAWTTYKVGIKPVRELFGVMAAEGVGNGKFITSGEFTREAIAFAEGKRLQLISGPRFLASIKRLPQEKQTALLKLALEGDYRTPTCPQCGYKMTHREGKNGRRDFWGCPRYPRCKSTLVCKSA